MGKELAQELAQELVPVLGQALAPESVPVLAQALVPVSERDRYWRTLYPNKSLKSDPNR